MSLRQSRPVTAAVPSQPAGFLSGGGEMGALMRSLDWSRTPIGPAEAWPAPLRTAVSICLSSRFPMLIWWGPELVKLYNDPYRPILGDKHPAALGRPGREAWPEIWDVIGPMLDGVMATGEATWSADQLLLMERTGYMEETYFTFSYSPIRDDDGAVAGVFTAVTETTEQVIGTRRIQTLARLSARMAEAASREEVARAAVAALGEEPADVPFALLYLFEDGEARLAGARGVPAGGPLVPERVALDPTGGRRTAADTLALGQGRSEPRGRRTRDVLMGDSAWPGLAHGVRLERQGSIPKPAEVREAVGAGVTRLAPARADATR